MFDVAGSLLGALARKRAGLESAASAVSRTQTQLGTPHGDRLLADAAGRAVFTEALLNAVHARLSEIKGVTHG